MTNATGHDSMPFFSGQTLFTVVTIFVTVVTIFVTVVTKQQCKHEMGHTIYNRDVCFK